MTMRIEKKSELSSIRNRAASFESTLDQTRCKRLGQFFTGLPLSRILAALSINKDCKSVIDPMAGHGDLLDAVLERCLIKGNKLHRVDAIEVDSAIANFCSERVKVWQSEYQDTKLTVNESSAFDSDLINTLPSSGYDLVITNPPYVRYQTISENGRKSNEDSLNSIRKNLLKIVSERIPRQEQKVWHELVKGFSGLSDLSVPSWLLAAMLVKPKGTLALVVPATWRTRDYADVLQYLLTRCFQVKAVIADRQPGWFSKALVRTHLIVATRLHTETILIPLCSRAKSKHKVVWAEVDSIAKEDDSLLGAAFGKDDPEGKFASWLFPKGTKPGLKSKGIVVTKHREDSISDILSVQRSSSWLKRVEPLFAKDTLFNSLNSSSTQWIPNQIKKIIPKGCEINLTNKDRL